MTISSPKLSQPKRRPKSEGAFRRLINLVVGIQLFSEQKIPEGWVEVEAPKSNIHSFLFKRFNSQNSECWKFLLEVMSLDHSPEIHLLILNPPKSQNLAIKIEFRYGMFDEAVSLAVEIDRLYNSNQDVS